MYKRHNNQRKQQRTDAANWQRRIYSTVLIITSRSGVRFTFLDGCTWIRDERGRAVVTVWVYGMQRWDWDRGYRMGSVPFQLIAAFFHLVLMQCSSGGTIGRSLSSPDSSEEQQGWGRVCVCVCFIVIPIADGYIITTSTTIATNTATILLPLLLPLPILLLYFYYYWLPLATIYPCLVWCGIFKLTSMKILSSAISTTLNHSLCGS